ncbi:hypothetical protein C6501_17680 [Candidatus Poribacteria bacterium]|nr:MAG: hypothetical protein C6501_17680 [Candidatus Poribacteria bacterium]
MNNLYKYAGLPLTPLMAQELILELFDGQTAGKEEIAGTVEETHLNRFHYQHTDTLPYFVQLGIKSAPFCAVFLGIHKQSISCVDCLKKDSQIKSDLW